mgnify:CR=1 FL=1|jgi:hypothetical protein|tara:strand:+ start:2198 stop:2386 length:189 start_codon:yes stop_codon:yes gene_type:complete
MYDDFDDYLDDVLDRFFSAEDGTELVLENIVDDELYIDELNDVEPTDDELDAIESELGKASV